MIHPEKFAFVESQTPFDNFSSKQTSHFYNTHVIMIEQCKNSLILLFVWTKLVTDRILVAVLQEPS